MSNQDRNLKPAQASKDNEKNTNEKTEQSPSGDKNKKEEKSADGKS